ncbi:hypothetical protein HWB19_gp122 [Cronobacter phage vB_CsaP_009]|uniref:Uncharacterized protein n=1 Tax=Cronobacter phage vB_CsaP_009 TaxID=2699738 RepID=A0A679FBZ3_9CAUD|nr:hypothetical protein HWB19_gp122 [Cronobacter phage vB_CsaP_009]BBU72768.1 hypothetical protein [Cronobacter phage vB_CsaP_009]
MNKNNSEVDYIIDSYNNRIRRESKKRLKSDFSGQFNKMLSTGLIDDEPFIRYHHDSLGSSNTDSHSNNYDSGSSDSGGSCD